MQRDGVKSGLLGSGGEGADGTAAVLWFQVEIVRGRRRRPVLRGSRVFWMFGKPLVFYKAVAEAETVVEVSPPTPSLPAGRAYPVCPGVCTKPSNQGLFR